MLRKETISSPLLESLAVLMEMKTLRTHKLVGGTALALQMFISLDSIVNN